MSTPNCNCYICNKCSATLLRTFSQCKCNLCVNNIEPPIPTLNCPNRLVWLAQSHLCCCLWKSHPCKHTKQNAINACNCRKCTLHPADCRCISCTFPARYIKCMHTSCYFQPKSVHMDRVSQLLHHLDKTRKLYAKITDDKFAEFSPIQIDFQQKV